MQTSANICKYWFEFSVSVYKHLICGGLKGLRRFLSINIYGAGWRVTVEMSVKCSVQGKSAPPSFTAVCLNLNAPQVWAVGKVSGPGMNLPV